MIGPVRSPGRTVGAVVCGGVARFQPGGRLPL